MSMTGDKASSHCESPGIDRQVPWSPLYTDMGSKRNPFRDRLKTSFPDFNSPSVFRVQSTPLCAAKPFKWSVEEMAILRPVDIEECPNQEVVDNSYFLTPRRAEASTKFFSSINSIPSLMSPCNSTLPASRTCSNLALCAETPSSCSFSRPAELQEILLSPIAAPREEENPATPIAPLNERENPDSAHMKFLDSTKPALTPPPLATATTESRSTREAGVDMGTQTMLTLPLDFDLERVLGRYAFYQGEDAANAESLRRILFHTGSSCHSPDTDPVATKECLPPNIRSNSSEDAHQKSDPQDTPRTSKHSSQLHSKSSTKSRSAKRLPVSSFSLTSSTPGSFLMSLVSDKLECSNMPTPLNAIPVVSPILSTPGSHISQADGDLSPPRNSSISEDCSSSLSQEPLTIPMSPIASSKANPNKSPNDYKATSTPFFHLVSKTPPSRLLSISLLPPSLMTSSREESQSARANREYLAHFREEEVIDEAASAASPPIFSDISQAPDKLQATHSLEADSGIGSSYGEQSSLTHNQSKSRPVLNPEHQLSFSFCPDRPPLAKSSHQTQAGNCSVHNEKVNKLRSKRGCVRADSSPLSIVHRAAPGMNESKRYQPESLAQDSFTDSCVVLTSNEAECVIDSFEPISPVLVQQQAKHIETIEKLKNFSKWTAHKKNIELRTNHS